ncbi:hypothetical protein QBZ16_000683 [Prototheca wickerhamii]|uniref:SRA1/Sec31 domain-containing protein n=1 Tax=Prototheca wickerhamii TaxID=3111 RepID=A0AAD9INQ8_PROWI|nr:hypothetical protein QBZ16_000683 [Prototheca wickerhamii]
MYGLLAGGLADGSICLWDPARFIGRSAGPKESVPLARLQKHRGPVRGLDSASGTLAKPAAPSLYPPMRVAGGGPGDAAPAPGSEISALAWNAKVQHIVATASSGGVVVWDLKKQRPVITLGGPGRRASAVRWNPEVATQLVVASDDDASPTLQLWDLRNAVTPLREFAGHSRGVLGLSWSGADPGLLLSSGKDSRTLVWDLSGASAAPFAELPPGPNWSFEVSWAPAGRTAGLFAGATFEGCVSLHSLGQCVPTGGSEAVVRVERVQTSPGGAADGADALSELEETALRGDPRALRALCERRERELAGSPEGETWAFLATHFAEDATRYLLTRLGFADELDRAEALARATAERERLEAEAGRRARGRAARRPGPGQPDGADAFFDNLSPVTTSNGAASLASPGGKGSETAAANGKRASPTAADAKDGAASPTKKLQPADDASDPAEALARALDAARPGPGEDAIQRALTIGDVAGAAEAALAAGRAADAVVLASLVGGEPFLAARLAYMAAAPRPFMAVVAARLRADERGWTEFVARRAAGRWRETLALLLSSAPPAEFPALCGALAGRLAAAGDRARRGALRRLRGRRRRGGDALGRRPPARGGRGPAGAPGRKGARARGRHDRRRGRPGAGAMTALLARYADALPEAYAQPEAYAGAYAAPISQPQQQQLYAAPSPATYVAANANYGVGSGATGGSAMTAPYSGQGLYGAAGAQPAYGEPDAYAAYQPPQQAAGAYQQGGYNSEQPAYGGAAAYAPPGARGAPRCSSRRPTRRRRLPWPRPRSRAPRRLRRPAFAGQSPTASTAGTAPPVYNAPAEAWHAPSFAAPPVAAGPPPVAAAPQRRPGGLRAPAPAAPNAGPAIYAPPALPSQHAAMPASPGLVRERRARAPGGPPPGTTLLSVDPSSAPPPLQPVIRSLAALYSTCEAAPAARELEDASRRLGLLAWRLSQGGVSDSVASKLQALAAALDAGDVAGATRVQAALTRDDWDESSGWLSALKRLIKLRQMLG